MNENNYIGIATDELYRVFGILNNRYFSDKLDPPMITLQKAKRRGNLGWFTLGRVWTDKEAEKPRYEINISAEHLGDDLNDVIGTLLHEMVHYSNKVAEIKDCNGQVHNRKFRDLAESVDLIIEKTKKYGFGCTTCSDPLKTYISETIKPDSNCFKYFRCEKAIQGEKKEKTIFTYECPQCGEKVRAKRDKRIICGECECEFEMKE